MVLMRCSLPKLAVVGALGSLSVRNDEDGVLYDKLVVFEKNEMCVGIIQSSR